MKANKILLVAVSVMALGVAMPVMAQDSGDTSTTSSDTARPDKAGKGKRDFRENRRDRGEDFRDRREDRRDEMEDFWDEQHDGGPRDRMEDRRDRREDVRDRREDYRDRMEDRYDRRHGPDSRDEDYERGGEGMRGPKDNVHGQGKGKGLSDERREAIREKLESLSPEERKAEIAKMRAEHKEKMEKRYEERKKRFDDRWDNASDDERTNICERAAERCADIMGSKMCEEIMGKCQ